MKVILLVFAVLFLFVFFMRGSISELLTGQVVQKSEQKILHYDYGSLNIYFCPQDNCEQTLVNEILHARTVDCASYDLDLESVSRELQKRNYRLILEQENAQDIDLTNMKLDSNLEFMHNKFCIFDHQKVITGSFNPTTYDAYRNNNNLIIIESTILAENYQHEFDEMWNAVFGEGDPVPHAQLFFNDFLIENYFCPEDRCEKRILDLLKSAKERIYFMTFSFTSDNIGNEIIKNFYYGLDVQDIFDTSQAGNRYSEFKKMDSLDMAVKKDASLGFMHHKVFIIDDTVVLGSYNPTQSGDTKNDENILVIHDRSVAEKFVEEFERLWIM